MFQSYAKYMERIFFYSCLDFEGKFPNGKRKLDVLSKDRHGNILGRWTPRWDERGGNNRRKNLGGDIKR